MSINFIPTPEIRQWVYRLSEVLGRKSMQYEEDELPMVRLQERIDTIHATMVLNGVSVKRDTTARILEGNPFPGIQALIPEVHHIDRVYFRIDELDPWSQASLHKAHEIINFEPDIISGRYRTMSCIILRGRDFLFSDRSAEEIQERMNDLFSLLASSKENLLIKSCLAHFWIETVCPFENCSGYLARIWQTLVLVQDYGVFRFIPWEKWVLQNWKEYSRTLSAGESCDNPSEFVLFMLKILHTALNHYELPGKRSRDASERILHFIQLGKKHFTRKDYMKVYRYISTATASRDLEKGVNAGLFIRTGTKNTTVYTCQNP